MKSWIPIVAVAVALALAACGGGATVVDPLAPNACIDAVALAYCNDFDRLDQTVVPFGFGEFVGGETTEVTVIAETGNRGLSVRSEGAAFGKAEAQSIGSATSASVQALVQQPAAAPGTSLTLGLLLLDGSAPDGRQVWLVANADGSLAVDALGTSLATTGRIEADRFTHVALDAAWTPGTVSITLDVRAAPAGEELVPILEGHVIDLAPPPEIGVAVAILSFDGGARHVVFDNVTLDLQ